MSKELNVFGEIFSSEEVMFEPIHTDDMNDIVENMVPTPSANAIKMSSTNHLLSKMLEQVSKVDLVRTLQNDLNDKLIKYQGENGLNRTKIPRALYIVAVMVELNKVAKKNGWAIAQEDEMFYLYNGVYWERVEDNEVKQFLSRVAIQLGYYSPADAMTANFSDAAFKQYVVHADIQKRSRNKDRVMINLLNGTYEVTSLGGQLRKHSADDFLTYVLPFGYDPNAKAPLFQNYLQRVLPDSGSQLVLQEFHGYVFIRHLKLEKALVLLGNGANGKSVQFEITKALFGEGNVSTKALGDLVDRDSGNDNRAKLKDKLLNYGSEIRANVMDVDIFKRLVSGEPVAAREKYKTSFDLENSCKFMFNANKLPMEIERTDAYFRRFIIVPYEQTITDDEKDPELHTKIISCELPGVLNWVIEGLQRLLQQKRFGECAAAHAALETYRLETNSVASFIDEEMLVPDSIATMPNRALYNMYTQWCSDSGMRRLSIRNFSKELVALGFESYRTGYERGFRIIRQVEL